MADEHDEHSSFIKTPQQLITVVVLAFVVPVVGIILLVQLGEASPRRIPGRSPRRPSRRASSRSARWSSARRAPPPAPHEVGRRDAQEVSPVQEIRGGITPGEIDIFKLHDLKQGQILYVTMENTSGNLDPTLAIVSASVDLPDLLRTYQADLQQLMQSAEYPLAELPALKDKTFLAWDDDNGPGYDAAIKFLVPRDGDYILAALGALSAAGRVTSGEYRLLLGVDAVGVLAGTAVPNGSSIAIQDETGLGWPGRVQEYTGSNCL